MKYVRKVRSSFKNEVAKSFEMIGRMKKLSLPIEYTKDHACDKGLISWNDDNCHFYYLDSSKTFYLSFKKSPVSIDRVEIITEKDVFPNDFSIFLSNDNKTWLNIIKNETFCDEENIISFHTCSTGCKNGSIKYFDAKQIPGYYHFLKFEMTSNTYIEGANKYMNLITFKGFEIFGMFLTRCTQKIRYCSSQKITIITLFLVITS